MELFFFFLFFASHFFDHLTVKIQLQETMNIKSPPKLRLRKNKYRHSADAKAQKCKRLERGFDLEKTYEKAVLSEPIVEDPTKMGMTKRDRELYKYLENPEEYINKSKKKKYVPKEKLDETIPFQLQATKGASDNTKGNTVNKQQKRSVSSNVAGDLDLETTKPLTFSAISKMAAPETKKVQPKTTSNVDPLFKKHQSLVLSEEKRKALIDEARRQTRRYQKRKAFYEAKEERREKRVALRQARRLDGKR